MKWQDLGIKSMQAYCRPYNSWGVKKKDIIFRKAIKDMGFLRRHWSQVKIPIVFFEDEGPEGFNVLFTNEVK